MRFQQESFAEMWGDAQPLLLAHWDEVAAKDLVGPLDVDVTLYEQLEAAGALFITTAREDGKLLGYAAYVVGPNMHYRSLRVAEADVFFLAREHRKGLAGLRLLQAAEKILLEAGVTNISQKVKVDHDCGVIFKRMGYAHIENVWMKAVA